MRRIRKISTAAALALSLGAAVGVTAGVPSAQAQTAAVARSGPTLKAAPAEAAEKPVVGTNLYVQQNFPLKDVEEWGARDLKYLHDTLKLKAVAIDWDYNVPNKNSNVVEASPTRTPTIADIKALTKIANSYGMRVEYRILFAIDNSDSRDSSITPRNLKAWLNALYATETDAFKLAQADKVSEFVVGSEMASIDQSTDWNAFFTKAAKIFKGTLSYASYGGHGNDGGFFSNSRVVIPTAPGNDLGVTGYPAIDLPKTATVAALTKAWETFLSKHTPAKVLKRTAIDEIGIPALDGSYNDPWQWDGLTGTADPAIQANWFQAVCHAATAEQMRGVYFWSEPINDDPAKPFDSLVRFMGRPKSVAAIKDC